MIINVSIIANLKIQKGMKTNFKIILQVNKLMWHGGLWKSYPCPFCFVEFLTTEESSGVEQK